MLSVFTRTHRVFSTSGHVALSVGLGSNCSEQWTPSGDVHKSFYHADLSVDIASAEQLKPKPLDWNTVPFGHVYSDHMFVCDWSVADGWNRPKIEPFRDFSMHPGAKVFHYATELFEGMKAYRGTDNKIRLFRPELNMLRMRRSAKRASLPDFDEKEFEKCISELDWVPFSETASLYLRPTLIGTEPTLGVAASNQAKLFVLACPVGPYYPTGFKPVSLLADKSNVRAFPGGAGAYKMGSNYAPTISVTKDALMKHGCQQVMWLFGDNEVVTEAGTMNMFMLWKNKEGDVELITPPLDSGLILPGVTRQSLLELVKETENIKVTEKDFTMQDIIDALKEDRLYEIFGAGTAAVVSPVHKIVHKRGDTYVTMEIPTMEHTPNLMNKLNKTICDIQYVVMMYTDAPNSFTELKTRLAEGRTGDDIRFKDLKPVIRDLGLLSEKKLSKLELDALRKKMNDLKVNPVKPTDDHVVIPAPLESFEELKNDALIAEFKRVGFSKPSPIQGQMWPCLMKGMDCVGVSQTGSGKTLAFLIPAFLHCDAQLRQYAPGEEQPCPLILVLTPTRELALQIEGEVEKYSYNGYKSVCLYGGAGRNEQMEKCANGVHIAIATPGRLADLANAGSVKLNMVSYVVLDEADRMLDMGFEADIRRIMLDIRPDRMTVLTSATWPQSVRGLAASYLKSAAMIVVGTLDLTACKSVTQYFEYFENEDEKEERLREAIMSLQKMHGDNFKMIVFVSKKVFADHISSDLCCKGINAQAMHGSRSQQDRENVLNNFRNGVVRILIATDLASRGIDVPNVTHVINFDFPNDIEEYVHRVGRTGRAGKSGEALTFLTYRNNYVAAQLICILENSAQEVPPGLHNMASKWKYRQERGLTGRGRGKFRKEKDNFQNCY